MTQLAVKEKLNTLEAEIKLLKIAFSNRLDFNVDEANWRKVKLVSSKARAKIFEKVYG